MNQITPDQADAILRKDVANIIQKLKDGKTLTAAERHIIQSQKNPEGPGQDEPARVKNKTELGRILGVERQTINQWKDLRGAPKALPNGWYDVTAWRVFIRENNLKGGETTVYENAKERRMKAQADRLEFENEIERGKYTANDIIEKEVARMVRSFKIVIEGIPRKAAMACAGRSATEIEKVLDAEINEALRQLHQDKWPQSP